eukprot:scaffold72242_cov60-Phaeocystis_antarctica.AAC.13
MSFANQFDGSAGGQTPLVLRLVRPLRRLVRYVTSWDACHSGFKGCIVRTATLISSPLAPPPPPPPPPAPPPPPPSLPPSSHPTPSPTPHAQRWPRAAAVALLSMQRASSAEWSSEIRVRHRGAPGVHARAKSLVNSGRLALGTTGLRSFNH